MNKPKKLSPDRKEAAILVLQFFKGNKEKAETWWRSHNPLLGVCPAEMVNSGRASVLLKFIKNVLADNVPEGGDMKRVNGIGHAADRLQERFGYKMDARASQEMLGLIRNCRWTPVKWEGNKLRVRMEFRGRVMDVVFNRLNMKIITVIPKDTLPKEEHQGFGNPATPQGTGNTGPVENPIPLKEEPVTRTTKGGAKCNICRGQMPVGWFCPGCEGEND